MIWINGSWTCQRVISPYFGCWFVWRRTQASSLKFKAFKQTDKQANSMLNIYIFRWYWRIAEPVICDIYEIPGYLGGKKLLDFAHDWSGGHLQTCQLVIDNWCNVVKSPDCICTSFPRPNSSRYVFALHRPNRCFFCVTLIMSLWSPVQVVYLDVKAKVPKGRCRRFSNCSFEKQTFKRFLPEKRFANFMFYVGAI